MSKNPTIFVSGGGRGIGREVCRKFAGHGATVIAVSRTEKELAETKESIERDGGTCHNFTLDVTDGRATNDLVRALVKEHGRLDGVVNCAGVAPVTDIEGLDDATWDKIIAVNMRGTFNTTRAVWASMKSGGGVIINISSVASVDPFPGLTAYGAAKAWVNTWTKGMANEGKPHDIRVFAVAPGAVDTRMLREAFPDYPTSEALEPGEIANVVYALAQPDCRYATGQTVFVQK